MRRVTDQTYLVSEQYRDAVNLEARIALHRRFSTNPQGWTGWVLDQLDLPAQARILELGCGPAGLWVENLERVPKGWEVILSDLSPGMVQQARTALPAGRGFRFQAVDAQSIPYADGSLDGVIANHMLYHVPDLDRALAEIRRVLKGAGVLYATTVGRRHMGELYDLLGRFAESDEVWTGVMPAGFALEDGAEVLRRFFPEVELTRYADALEITEVEPLVAYVQSMMSQKELLRGRTTADLADFLRAELESGQGVLRVRKDSGLFVARQGYAAPAERP